ncbi:hypothetical protein R0135_13115 [Congregibacter variabilis]|uniref:Uncharacterized protein n=1 Tax=Congregibacter variabilis TaxID=3081200 RepID=A0ABZ0I266_9GAMM|nr:hypothetical protein R0135_13115 [Congregibacter sp. IMCC43200]
MDTTTMAIAISASLLFFGVLIYKAVWFIRKVQQAPDSEEKPSEAEGQTKQEPEASLGQDLQ